MLQSVWMLYGRVCRLIGSIDSDDILSNHQRDIKLRERERNENKKQKKIEKLYPIAKSEPVSVAPSRHIQGSCWSKWKHWGTTIFSTKSDQLDKIVRRKRVDVPFFDGLMAKVLLNLLLSESSLNVWNRTLFTSRYRSISLLLCDSAVWHTYSLL